MENTNLDLQVQVQIGETRRVFFIQQPSNYLQLANAIKREIPKTKFMDFSLQFENDESEYVVLNSSDALCLRVAITSAKNIPGTEIRRLKLRVFEGSSPSTDKTETKKTASESDFGPRKNKIGQSHTRISLEYSQVQSPKPKLSTDKSNAVEFHGELSNDSEDDTDSNDDLFEGKSPLQRYVLNTEKKIQEKQVLITKLREKENDITRRINRVKSNQMDGNICKNCHLRLGHTARTCDLDKCSSVFKCGEEKFHSGETNTREIRTQIKKHEMELTKLKVELDNKKFAIEKSKDTLSNKLECVLFQAKKEDYLVNGQRNWSLLRKHVYAVEQYCKQHLGGRLPAKQDISEILESALSENMNSSLGYHRAKQSQSGKRKRENPFNPHLEKYGIRFPDKSDTTDNPCDKSDTTSSIMATAPETESQEHEQLAIVMRESLRNTPQMSSSQTLAQNVFPIVHQTATPVLENYPSPTLAMSMNMYPNLPPYMQPYVHRVETPAFNFHQAQFPINTALPTPLLRNENVEINTEDNVIGNEVNAENDAAAILVNMHENSGDNRATNSTILDELLDL